MWVARSSSRSCQLPSPASSSYRHIHDLPSSAAIPISSLQILPLKSDCRRDPNYVPRIHRRDDENECSVETVAATYLHPLEPCSNAPSPSRNPSRIRRAEFHSKHCAKALRAARASHSQPPSS